MHRTSNALGFDESPRRKQHDPAIWNFSTFNQRPNTFCVFANLTATAAYRSVVLRVICHGSVFSCFDDVREFPAFFTRERRIGIGGAGAVLIVKNNKKKHRRKNREKLTFSPAQTIVTILNYFFFFRPHFQQVFGRVRVWRTAVSLAVRHPAADGVLLDPPAADTQYNKKSHA